MKYHIVFKFLAVALCAAFLLVSLASAAGILLLASQGLYGTSLDSLLERAEESALERYAQYVGSRYASVNLGGCPEEMIESLDGWMEEDYAQNQFQPGAVGYRIQDPEGNVVEDRGLESYSRVVNFPFTDSYRELLSLKTQEAYDNQTAPTIDQNALLYNAIPSRGTMVSAAYFYDENGSELVSTTETGVPALAYYSQEGDVLLRTTEPMELMLSETVVAGVSYEINRFAGRHDNWLTGLLRAPGLALQRMTTAEPTDDMMEVAIEAMNRVIPENEGEDNW